MSSFSSTCKARICLKHLTLFANPILFKSNGLKFGENKNKFTYNSMTAKNKNCQMRVHPSNHLISTGKDT